MDHLFSKVYLQQVLILSPEKSYVSDKNENELWSTFKHSFLAYKLVIAEANAVNHEQTGINKVLPIQDSWFSPSKLHAKLYNNYQQNSQD